MDTIACFVIRVGNDLHTQMENGAFTMDSAYSRRLQVNETPSQWDLVPATSSWTSQIIYEFPFKLSVGAFIVRQVLLTNC